jgi:hypothetical protein
MKKGSAGTAAIRSPGAIHEGRYIAVVYQEVIEGVIRVRTAYDVPEP